MKNYLVIFRRDRKTERLLLHIDDRNNPIRSAAEVTAWVNKYTHGKCLAVVQLEYYGGIYE